MCVCVCIVTRTEDNFSSQSSILPPSESLCLCLCLRGGTVSHISSESVGRHRVDRGAVLARPFSNAYRRTLISRRGFTLQVAPFDFRSLFKPRRPAGRSEGPRQRDLRYLSAIYLFCRSAPADSRVDGAAVVCAAAGGWRGWRGYTMPDIFHPAPTRGSILAGSRELLPPSS